MKKKKRPVTLIEMMIVIMLIGLIGGALAFNMRGSMNEGRAFKSEATISKVEDILDMALAAGDLEPENVAEKWQTIVQKSPLAGKKASDTLKDGWNKNLTVKYDETSGNVVVTSEKLDAYRAKKKA